MKKTIIFICLIFSINNTFGAGVVGHRYIAKRALDYMKMGDLKNLLRRNFRVYMAGATFPDAGFVAGVFDKSRGWWGEDTHWGNFQNFFLGYLKKHCKSKGFPPKNSSFCEHQWALFFGSTAHGFGDVGWDANYVPRVALMKYGSRSGQNYHKADSATTNGGDSVGVVKYGQRDLAGSLNYDWTLHVFNAYADYKKKPRMTKGLLMVAHKGQEAWYWGHKMIGFWAYLSHQRNWRWAVDNYYWTIGGIRWNAILMAKAWDLIWSNVHRYKLVRYDRMYETGGWPYKTIWDFRVNGQRAKLFWPDYRYPGGAPSGQTYQCRYGLYWGSWRLKGWGPAKTCTNKGTADNAKNSCNRARKWWFKCKAF